MHCYFTLKKEKKVAKLDKNALREFCGDTAILVYKDEREREKWWVGLLWDLVKNSKPKFFLRLG